MLQIMKTSTIEPDGIKGEIHVRSTETGPPFDKAFDELKSPQARTYALQYAESAGCHNALLNDNVEGPYAVNEDGFRLDEVRDSEGKAYPIRHPKMQPKWYQISVKVHRKMT